MFIGLCQELFGVCFLTLAFFCRGMGMVWYGMAKVLSFYRLSVNRLVLGQVHWRSPRSLSFAKVDRIVEERERKSCVSSL